MIFLQQPHGRVDHLHHHIRILGLEKTDHRFLCIALRREGQFFREPGVDLLEQVCVFFLHHVILDHLPAHAENALGILGIGCQFSSLDPNILKLHSLTPFRSSFTYVPVSVFSNPIFVMYFWCLSLPPRNKSRLIPRSGRALYRNFPTELSR